MPLTVFGRRWRSSGAEASCPEYADARLDANSTSPFNQRKVMSLRIAILVASMGFVTGNVFNPVMASDCRGVKFNFENRLQAKIRIGSVMIEGDKGQLTQDINNKVVFAGESYTTDKLQLDDLDAGSTGSFKVRYRWFDADTGKWRGEKLHEASRVRCENNMTIRFRIQ